MENETGELLDILVLGAGLSGLTAAYEILKADPTVKLNVLEAKSKSIFDESNSIRYFNSFISRNFQVELAEGH